MAAARPDPARDRRSKPYEATLKAIVAGGGTILAGTDSPIVPYGLGLHVELESYVHAGLTPFQALQTATVNAAQALGVGDEIGTIEPGKLADLTFLGSDPLIDIRNTRDVKRVMRGGRLFTVTDLLEEVETADAEFADPLGSVSTGSAMSAHPRACRRMRAPRFLA